MHISSQKAFTLIELSIVLVIIALLAGGVLVGRSLLRQSEVATIMTDTQKYITAIKAFKEKYMALPGDMANATDFWGAAGGIAPYNSTTACISAGSTTSTATCNGDGDGQIYYNNETLRVWQHLANAGLITGQYPGTGTSNLEHVPGVNCPASKLSGAGFSIAYAYYKSGDTRFFDGNYAHRMALGLFYAGGHPVTAAITGPEMQSMDVKFDDGKPALGKIRSFKNGSLGSPNCVNSGLVTAVYSTSNNIYCTPLILPGF